MSENMTRRETLRRGLAATSVLAMVPDWAMPALAQDEVDVPFTDIPKNFNPGANPNAPTRVLDIRKIDGPYTSKDQFYALQHMNRPEIDPATYRLKLTGLVSKPAEFSLTDLDNDFYYLLRASPGQTPMDGLLECSDAIGFHHFIGRELDAELFFQAHDQFDLRSYHGAYHSFG